MLQAAAVVVAAAAVAAAGAHVKCMMAETPRDTIATPLQYDKSHVTQLWQTNRALE